MKLWELFQADVLSLGFTLIGALILHLFRSRVKIVWGDLHQFTFVVSVPPSALPPPGNSPDAPNPQRPATSPSWNVHTKSIFIRNAGRVPATDVEITFNWMPANHNIWPVRPYEVQHSPDSRFTLKFSNLAPKEQFQIELLSAPAKLPDILGVRSKESVGEKIPLRAVRDQKSWLIVLFWAFVLLGVAFLVQLIARLVILAF